jgi:hypothetical protein
MPAPKGHLPYPGCETGGTPKRFTDEFIEKEADAFEEWMNRPESIWYKDFALERGYDPDQLSIWAKENEKFAGVYKRSQSWQQSKLVKGGLLSVYNSTITKLVLANTCGWSDKQQVSGDAANPLQFLLDKVDGSSKELYESD